MKKVIHIIEGTTLTEERDGQERVVSFAADIVDTYVELDAEGLTDLMRQCAHGNFNGTVEDIQRMMDAGADTFVVEHIGEHALMHFIKDAVPTGTLASATLH